MNIHLFGILMKIIIFSSQNQYFRSYSKYFNNYIFLYLQIQKYIFYSFHLFLQILPPFERRWIREVQGGIKQIYRQSWVTSKPSPHTIQRHLSLPASPSNPMEIHQIILTKSPEQCGRAGTKTHQWFVGGTVHSDSSPHVNPNRHLSTVPVLLPTFPHVT